MTAFLALTPAVSLAQVPAGAEFRANTYTTGAQRSPSIARAPDGDFVVVWESTSQDGSQKGIFGQRYAASVAPRGDEFRINAYTTNDQALPSVAVDARGRFVAVWEGEGPGGSPSDVFARRYDAAGLPIGGEFLVNSYTTSHQDSARVGSGSGGDFVVVWESNQGIDGTEVMGQRFDRTGQRLGGEFLVNGTTTGWQFGPAVDARPGNEFVVAWSESEGGTPYSIFVRVFDAQGNPAGLEQRVNSSTTESHRHASVAVADDGRFVVVWQAWPPSGPSWRILARRFNAAGIPLGGEFQVNTYTSQVGILTAVSADAAANFVVTWPAWQDGAFQAVEARRYSADGSPRSAEFLVNTYTTESQYRARVGSDRDGNFVVTWSSYGQDGSGPGVFAQRFGGLHPRALDVDTGPGPTQDGNHVLEPGESVNVVPRWQNLNGAPQTFAGAIADVTGPPGCVQVLLDGAGSYGTVANGATAPCTDCYRVLAFSSGRCQQHWDIRAVETLTPDSQGQVKDWALHVGESFTDVPDTSSFYKFVETLLHHDITGGCSLAEYCPTSSTTREQMVVFMLLAKEGTGYAPPACVPPNMFDDVPETSPFCRWVEEAGRRGMAVGCSTSPPLFCPHEPVTREQMSVLLLRTLDPALNPPACVPGGERFGDVPASSPFCRWIEELARRGVVAGCSTNPPLFCPASAVTREQMAVFISVPFGLTLYGP